MNASASLIQASQSTLEALSKRHEMLSRHTSMKTGGPASWWAEPNDEDELAAILREVTRRGLPLRSLGAGSNLVALDEGCKGVILHLGRGFETMRVEENRLVAGGAALLPKLTKFALQNNLGNFEWACGIPGSAGGSIWGNAGARGFNGQAWESRDCAADLQSVIVFDRDGRRQTLQRNEIEFGYRRSSLGDFIIVEATFALKPLSEADAVHHREAVRDLLQKRRETQPANAASAGCIWKNPDRAACEANGCRGTGELIEKLGLKGLSVGGAQVSPLHGNFVVNNGGASGADVTALIEEVERRVKMATGIELEPEVRFLG